MRLRMQFLVSLGCYLFALFLYALPEPLFSDPVCDLLYASDTTFLSGRIASDGQWRFPAVSTVPDRFTRAIIAYEDKRFFSHPGIDPLALGRAVWQNIRNNRIESGASTLSMQVIRLHRKGRKRLYSEKIIESILALRLELKYSKKEILSLYAQHAPFGGNVVGLDAAAWRYFGRDPRNLSWAETATLAVLPNAPSLIRPGLRQKRLRAKRDKLLYKLYEQGEISKETYELALEEDIPGSPFPLPDKAPHLLEQIRKEKKKGVHYVSLDPYLQERANYLVNQYGVRYASNHVYNICLLAAEVKSGRILAYTGNTSFPTDGRRGQQVDMIRAERSTGSLLKPFLYAAMIQEGMILPDMLVPDVPTYFRGFSPQNYNRDFQGAVRAHKAIERSLNVPLVKMLLAYDYGRFCDFLKQMGMNTLHYPADHYGVSLILGGAEGNLWNLMEMYASMGQLLLQDAESAEKRIPSFSYQAIPEDRYSRATPLKPVGAWFALEAMSNLTRPEEESEWNNFASMKRIAWKTGTSFGARDAWAIGMNAEYIVGVWVGNASGEGRPGVSGVEYAAPVLFDFFSVLPASPWFKKPQQEWTELAVCRQSGYKAGPFCEPVDTLMLPAAGIKTECCPYHRRIFINKHSQRQTTASCCSAEELLPMNWFVLPPVMESYYAKVNADYRPLPPFDPACQRELKEQIGIIYPKHGMNLILPRGFDGRTEKFVFKAVHTRPEAILYWHLNSGYLGETKGEHHMALAPSPGSYTLTLVDETGSSRTIQFSISSPKK